MIICMYVHVQLYTLYTQKKMYPWFASAASSTLSRKISMIVSTLDPSSEPNTCARQQRFWSGHLCEPPLAAHHPTPHRGGTAKQRKGMFLDVAAHKSYLMLHAEKQGIGLPHSLPHASTETHSETCAQSASPNSPGNVGEWTWGLPAPAGTSQRRQHETPQRPSHCARVPPSAPLQGRHCNFWRLASLSPPKIWFSSWL